MGHSVMPRGIFMACALVVAAGCRTTPGYPPGLLPPSPARAVVVEDVTDRREIERLRLSQSPVQFCPTGVNMVIYTADLGTWLAGNPQSPLAGHARRLLSASIPHHAWAEAKGRLGLDGEGLFRRYFGSHVAIVALGNPRRDGILLVGSASEEALREAPRAFALTRTREYDRSGFRFYEIRQDTVEYAVAIDRGWFILAEKRNLAGIRVLIDTGIHGGRDSLVSDPEFLDLAAKLPEHRLGLIYGRDRKGLARHMAAAVPEGDSLVVHYLSTDPSPVPAVTPSQVNRNVIEYLQARAKLTDVPGDADFPYLSHSDTLDLGPLPPGTVGVAVLNAVHHCPMDLGILDMPVVFGSVRQRILPGISPPLLGFVGLAETQCPSGGATVEVPTAGVAIRLLQPGIAEDIDRLLQTFHFLATLGSFELGKVFFGIDTMTEGDIPFHVADFGSSLIRWLRDPAVAALANLPEPAGLRRIAFGRIGEWYVVCTQESFFRECVQAYRDPARRYDTGSVYAGFGLQSHPGLLFSAMTDVPSLSRLLNTVQGQLVTGNIQGEEAAGAGAEASSAETHSGDSEPPVWCLQDAMAGVNDLFTIVARSWRDLYTLPVDLPKAKENKAVQAAREEDSRRSPQTDPDRALQPLNWLANAIRRQYSFAGQIWRAPDGSPRGILKIVTAQPVIPHP